MAVPVILCILSSLAPSNRNLCKLSSACRPSTSNNACLLPTCPLSVSQGFESSAPLLTDRELSGELPSCIKLVSALRPATTPMAPNHEIIRHVKSDVSPPKRLYCRAIRSKQCFAEKRLLQVCLLFFSPTPTHEGPKPQPMCFIVRWVHSYLSVLLRTLSVKALSGRFQPTSIYGASILLLPRASYGRTEAASVVAPLELLGL